MAMRVRKPWKLLVSQEASIDNARTASTALSQRRVEREEVEMFLAAHVERVTKSASA